MSPEFTAITKSLKGFNFFVECTASFEGGQIYSYAATASS